MARCREWAASREGADCWAVSSLLQHWQVLSAEKCFLGVPKVYFLQGWEFAHRFPEGVTLFLPKNERISDSLKKRAIRSFTHFWWATWAIRSCLLIFGERSEQIAHGCSFLVSDLSDLLTLLIIGERPEQFAHIAHFWWVTWAIRSHGLPKKREWANRSFFK